MKLTSDAAESVVVDYDNSLFVEIGASSVAACAAGRLAGWLWASCCLWHRRGHGFHARRNFAECVSFYNRLAKGDPAATAPFPVSTTATVASRLASRMARLGLSHPTRDVRRC